MRRSIAAARSYSISCSQIAHASASKGSGRRVTRSHGRAAQRSPDQPIAGKAPAGTAADRHPRPSAKRMRAIPYSAAGGSPRSAPNRTRPRRRLTDAHEHRHRLARAAAARAPPRAGASCRPCPCAGKPEGPGRASPPALQLDRVRSKPALPLAASPGPPSRCTSTSSERLPTICSSSPTLAGARILRRREQPPAPAGCAAKRRRLAAAPLGQPHDRRTRHEPARRHRRRLDRRERRRLPRRGRVESWPARSELPAKHRRRVRQHRQAVSALEAELA